MQTSLPLSPTVTTNEAHRQAALNWAANLRALAGTQPRLVDAIQGTAAPVDWLFARDGTLTAMSDGGQWWTGCSLPARTAQVMLKRLDIGGVVACFLLPTHAAQLQVSLARLRPSQAIVAILPELLPLRVALGCEDFSKEIEAGRLWFVWGDRWAEELASLLEEIPGLPTPTQFIRLPISKDAEVDPVIAAATKVFADETTRRTAAVAGIVSRSASVSSSRRLCVVAPSHFRLWDDAAVVLRDVLAGEASVEITTVDADQPASASPLALAAAAAGCDAVITANVVRASLPGLVPMDKPWVSWITSARIPGAGGAGPNDGLLLADPAWVDLALRGGWAERQLGVAGWPAAAPSLAATGRHCAVLLDTVSLDPPREVENFSSHNLLWTAIRNELTENPFVIADDFDRYLTERMQSKNISEEGFNRDVFLERLVLPAWQQAMVRVLAEERIPLRVFGTGWEQIEDLKPHFGGFLRTRLDFDAAVAGAAALAHLSLAGGAHPIDRLNRPVIRRTGRRRETFLRDATAATAGKLAAPVKHVAPLSAESVRQLLQR